MGYFFKGDKVTYIDDLSVKLGRADGLVELSEEEVSNHLTGNYIVVNGAMVEKSKSAQKIISEIDAQLLSIDVKKVRPMSAILAASEGGDTSEDMAYLSQLETQAVALRAQRAELVGE